MCKQNAEEDIAFASEELSPWSSFDNKTSTFPLVPEVRSCENPKFEVRAMAGYQDVFDSLFFLLLVYYTKTTSS